MMGDGSEKDGCGMMGDGCEKDGRPKLTLFV